MPDGCEIADRGAGTFVGRGRAPADRRTAVAELEALVSCGIEGPDQNFRALQLRAAARSSGPNAPALVEAAAPTVALFAREAPAPQGEDARIDVPEWIELIPAPLPGADDGHIETRDYRRGFLVKDPQAIVDKFYEAPEARRALVLDWEHKSHRNWLGIGHNPAAGWIEDLEVRDPEGSGRAIWARIDWTPEGRDDVALKRYRYISPVVAIMFPADSEGRIDWDAVPEATELLDGALTNKPATYIRDLAMTPASEDADAASESSVVDGGSATLAATRAPAPTKGRYDDNEEPMAIALSIFALTALGLSQDASQEDVDAAILKLAETRTPIAPPEQATTVDVKAITESVTRAVVAQLSAGTGVSDPEARAAIEELKAKRESDIAEAKKTAVDVVLAEASAAKKFAPAERDHLVKVGLAMGPEALREQLAARPSLQALFESGGSGLVPETQAEEQIEITPDVRLICEQQGISLEAWAAEARRQQKKSDAA